MMRSSGRNVNILPSVALFQANFFSSLKIYFKSHRCHRCCDINANVIARHSTQSHTADSEIFTRKLTHLYLGAHKILLMERKRFTFLYNTFQCLKKSIINLKCKLQTNQYISTVQP